MKIAYVQPEIIAGRPDINAEKILNFIEQAKKNFAEIVIFPDFCLSGKFIGRTFQQESFQRDLKYFGDKIIAASDGIKIIFGNMNKIFVAQDKKIITEKNCGEIIQLENLKCKISCEPFKFDGDKNILENLIYVNCVGIQNKGKTIYTFAGESSIYNSRGEIVQRIENFTEGMNFIELDEIDKLPALENSIESDIEKIYRAISFGVKKFLAQIGINKVVIGISGGIDSAVAAALYTKIIGAENIYLVNMPSVYNSTTTKNLSEQLAKNLGCKYLIVPIQESVNFTVNQLEGVGINISNFVRENIQARDRSSRILAAISAAVGGVFTCNANKAETTVGYATLYGDEAGFLCALADLWKFQIYELANYLNNKIYQHEVIPQGIIDIVPSAELSTAQNVDEGKGDPIKYLYHDYLFRAFVEKNLSPEDILNFYDKNILEDNIGCEKDLVEKYFPSAKDFIEDLERWWKLFTGMAVAKRIQSPPILAVTNHAFGSDFNESQNLVHFTVGYKNLREKILSK